MKYYFYVTNDKTKEPIGIIDAGVHSVDWEAKLLLSTPRDSGARPVLSDWHPEERLIFFDEDTGELVQLGSP